jgi:hypothetical protein
MDFITKQLYVAYLISYELYKMDLSEKPNVCSCYYNYYDRDILEKMAYIENISNSYTC